MTHVTAWDEEPDLETDPFGYFELQIRDLWSVLWTEDFPYNLVITQKIPPLRPDAPISGGRWMPRLESPPEVEVRNEARAVLTNLLQQSDAPNAVARAWLDALRAAGNALIATFAEVLPLIEDSDEFEEAQHELLTVLHDVLWRHLVQLLYLAEGGVLAARQRSV